MKKLFYLILPIMFCTTLNFAIANDTDESNNDKTDGLKREATTKEINVDNESIDADESVADDAKSKKPFLKEQKKAKKKGKRNVTVQPSKEDDENIIMYLDRAED